MKPCPDPRCESERVTHTSGIFQENLPFPDEVVKNLESLTKVFCLDCGYSSGLFYEKDKAFDAWDKHPSRK